MNEQMGLVSTHTLWMREHNRIAAILKANNGGLSDNRLFLETRKVVGAMMQKITYYDFLPLILGDKLDDYKLTSSNPGHRQDIYDKTTDPSIRNAFATAAYR